jgi:hypothetical protein
MKSRNSVSIVSDFPDPSRYLLSAARRLKRRPGADRPTRAEYEGLLHLIFANSKVFFADKDGAIFVLTLPAELLDLIAVFGAMDDDAEEDDAPEPNDGGEADPPPGDHYDDDPDIEGDDADLEDNGDGEPDARDLDTPTYADPHDQTSEIDSVLRQDTFCNRRRNK